MTWGSFGVFLAILGSIEAVTVVDHHPEEEYYTEHEILYKDAIEEARRLKLYPGPIPGCKVCTSSEMTYCRDGGVINDHCCCDNGPDDGLIRSSPSLGAARLGQSPAQETMLDHRAVRRRLRHSSSIPGDSRTCGYHEACDKVTPDVIIDTNAFHTIYILRKIVDYEEYDIATINKHTTIHAAEVFKFVPHVCRIGPEPCRVHAEDCAEYTRLRECCCFAYHAEKWKNKASGSKSIDDKISRSLTLLASTVIVKLFLS